MIYFLLFYFLFFKFQLIKKAEILVYEIIGIEVVESQYPLGDNELVPLIASFKIVYHKSELEAFGVIKFSGVTTLTA